MFVLTFIMVFFTCMYVHIGHDIYGLLTFYPATPREPSVISTVYQIKKIKAIFFISLMIRGLGVLFSYFVRFLDSFICYIFNKLVQFGQPPAKRCSKITMKLFFRTDPFCYVRLFTRKIAVQIQCHECYFLRFELFPSIKLAAQHAFFSRLIANCNFEKKIK